MVRYKIYNLTSATSGSDQSKLFDAVTSLAGMSDVTVDADSGEIGFVTDGSTGRETLAMAVSRVGFLLRGRADRWTG